MLEANAPTPAKWTSLRPKFEEIRGKSEAFLAQGRGEEVVEAEQEDENKTQA